MTGPTPTDPASPAPDPMTPPPRPRRRSAYEEAAADHSVCVEVLPALAGRWGVVSLLRELEALSRRLGGAQEPLPGPAGDLRDGLRRFLRSAYAPTSPEDTARAGRADPFTDPAPPGATGEVAAGS